MKWITYWLHNFLSFPLTNPFVLTWFFLSHLNYFLFFLKVISIKHWLSIYFCTSSSPLCGWAVTFWIQSSACQLKHWEKHGLLQTVWLFSNRTWVVPPRHLWSFFVNACNESATCFLYVTMITMTFWIENTHVNGLRRDLVWITYAMPTYSQLFWLWESGVPNMQMWRLLPLWENICVS